MIEQKLHNYFKHFTSITPRAEFASRSLARITTTAQMPATSPVWFMRVKESLTTGGALAMASLLLLIVLGGISYVAKQSGQVVATASLGDAALMREASQLTFNVQLKDAQYFDESASQVARALDRISGNGQSF